ncbi:ABC transporter substrate-binding protein [Sutcliffiella cohnii]|uniref:ABC transporter substrate-binding protein n=1 Tax=Sutcliffiella cohnii TaxID=33932 RepID=UPI002E1B88C4|nr:ABC transporter substrate-binding protein [Sutcliffiella cohnii]
MKNKYIVGLLIILLFIPTLQSTIAAEQVKSLKVGITKDENTLNPYTYVTGYPGLDLVNLLYDNLFQLDEQNLPQPWLVEDYEVSEDGLTYKLTLHENVAWHDGKPLTTEDVKFTMEYFKEHPKSRFTNPLAVISSIDIQDETNMTLVLSQGSPNFFIQPLADLPILPKHIWSEISNPDDSTDSLGSGPYMLEQYVSGQFYKMKANPNYFKGTPAIEEIIFPIIEDTTALFTALQAKEIDAISSSISPELVSQFETNPNLKVIRGAGYSTTLVQINAERYPMDQKEFRQAMAYAIDTQYLVDTVLLGFAELGSPGFIHPSSPFYNSELSFEPNMDRAKQILEEAGFIDTNNDGYREDQQGNELELTSLVYANNPIRIRTAEIIAEWLNEIGIKVNVRAMDATTVDSMMWPDFDVSKGRDFDLGVWGWSNTMQLFPDRMMDLFHSDPSVGSVNIGAYESPEFDELASLLKNTIDETERTEIIKEMQALVADEFPIIPLYYQEIVNAYHPSVYDGFSFQLGKGIIHKMSFLTFENDTAAPPTDKKEDEVKTPQNSNEELQNASSGSSNNSLLILGLIIALLVVGGFVIKRKSTSKKDDVDF